MSAHPQHEQFRFIPVGQLTLSPLNVRKTGGDNGIEELAALIQSQGLLQNLTVYEEPRKGRKQAESYPVVAGGRRWRALQLLLTRHDIAPTFEVPCLITTYERAVEMSLAENCGREGMHPADQFEAFKTLIDAGKSTEEVAARFGVTPLVVQRRLKLANVAPEFLQRYREGEIMLEHLMALALTDDHDKQRRAWESLREYDRHPPALRRALTDNEISLREPIVRFVGVKAYEKAGGAIRRDLFGEADDGFILDAQLLRNLATAKLNKHTAHVKAQGAAWVEIAPALDYVGLSAYARVRHIEREATPEEQQRIDELNGQLRTLEERIQAEQDEAQLEELSEHAAKIEGQLDQLQDQRTVPDPQQAVMAGAIVSIGADGKVRIEGGLLKPEDAKRIAAGRPDACGEGGERSSRAHSAALVRRLTAHRTRALQAALIEQPSLATVALTHRLVLDTFFSRAGGHGSPLHIDMREVHLTEHADDLAGSKADLVLTAKRDAWLGRLPSTPEGLLSWLLEQTAPDVQQLLAYCIAVSIDGVTSQEVAHPVDEIVKAAQLDMRQWWSPTAQGYLTHVPKARVLEIIGRAVSAEAAGSLEHLKKGPLTAAAEQLLAKTGWLPAVLDH